MVYLAVGGMGDWIVLSRHGCVRVCRKIGDQGEDDREGYGAWGEIR